MNDLQQPQLGQTIQALRQEKKLTQEELVEQCNVNVRTLQRIEAGDVTPRDYTIKAILSVLDYKFEDVASSISKKRSLNRMHVGWVAGIVYFVFGLLEAGVDYFRFEDDNPFYFPLIYTTVKTLSLVAYGMLMLGFVEVGKIYKNSLLKISAFLMLGSWAVIEIYDVISIFSEITYNDFILIKGCEAVIFGGIDVIFGIALFRLGKELGTTSRAAGIFEILAGMFFVTFFLAFLGLFMLVPATILEIILLHKAYDILKNEPSA